MALVGVIGSAVLGGLPRAEARLIARGHDTVRIARLAPAVAAAPTREAGVRPYRMMPPHWIDARRLDRSATVGAGLGRPRHFSY